MNEVKILAEQANSIRNFECDFKQELKPSALLGFFQEIAADHAEELGFGDSVLRKEGMFWVLSKIYAEVTRKPVCGENITVKTWPHAPNKAIFERSFELIDEKGERAISAFSRWCILNASGRIVPASRIPCKADKFIDERAADAEDFFVPFDKAAKEPSFSIKIANSEYDLNYHVNNIKYADYIFNCFSVNELKERALKSFQIHYVKQSREGDVLEFYREEVAPGVFAVEGVKNGEETVITAGVRFD